MLNCIGSHVTSGSDAAIRLLKGGSAETQGHPLFWSVRVSSRDIPVK
jgi:hypothetical protein